jgi:hypothetical protein
MKIESPNKIKNYFQGTSPNANVIAIWCRAHRFYLFICLKPNKKDNRSYPLCWAQLQHSFELY